jgi:ketosteroid isomerase-like protein
MPEELNPLGPLSAVLLRASAEQPISRENVEIVRSIYAKRLLDLRSGHELLAEVLIEYVNPPDAIDPGVRHGSREVERALANLADLFDQRENRLKRIFDGGDTVVAEVVFSGRGTKSGVEVTQEEAHTWTFREGRPVRFEWGRNLAEALDAVGLTE